MKSVPGYTPAELEDLKNEALVYLGRRIIFRDLHVEGNHSVPVGERILSTRGSVALAIPQVDFYPHQSPNWQQMLEECKEPNGNVARKSRTAGEIFSKMGQAGNPLVGVVLPRGPHAKTDPLAMFPRVMAVFPNGHVEEGMTWKKLLTHRRLGSMRLDSGQMPQLRDAINWEPSDQSHSHVRIADVRGEFPVEESPVLSTAHKDQQGRFSLADEAIPQLRDALQKLLEKEL